MNAQRPGIICLCGSTRFWEAFRDHGLRLTLEGKIVLSIGIAAPDSMIFAHANDEEGKQVKARLDALHKQKIDLADEILVLNVGGYIGDSTRSEIEHARQRGKVVRWLEPPAQAGQNAADEQKMKVESSKPVPSELGSSAYRNPAAGDQNAAGQELQPTDHWRGREFAITPVPAAPEWTREKINTFERNLVDSAGNDLFSPRFCNSITTLCDMALDSIKLREENARLRGDNTCDACAGTGTPTSGLQCMCGGTGRMSDAARYLRERLYEANMRIFELEQRLADTCSRHIAEIAYQERRIAELKGTDKSVRLEARATALMDAAATTLDRRTLEVFHARFRELFAEIDKDKQQ